MRESNVTPSSAPVRRGALSALGLGFAVLLSCAGDTAPPSVEAEPVVRGGILRMVQEAPRSLDPLDSDSVYESLPVNQIFDTLVTTDASLNVIPALAETWTISEDGRVYDFHLRPGIRFHDGSELEVQDVVYTLKRLLREGRQSLAFPYLLIIEGAEGFSGGRLSELSGVSAPDARTVRIRLERPYPSFLEVLAMDNLGVVPRRVVEQRGRAEFARSPVGTGPFRLVEWTTERMTLASNREYFGGTPNLDGVELAFLRSDEDDFGAARFDRGALDLLEPPTDSLPRLAADASVNLYRYQELSLSFLGLNTRAPPLDQLWLRQAIACALNRDSLVSASPTVRRDAVGILPPGLPGYSPEPKALAHDPARARRLLAEAGHPEGKGLPPIRLYAPSQGSAVMQVINQIRSDLDAVGIRVELVAVNWTEMGERLENGTTEAFLLAWVADLTDPESFLSMFETEGPGNHFGFTDALTDRWLEEGAAELNPVERGRIFRNIERRVLEQAPLVPLYHTVGIVAMRNELRGLKPGPLGLARVELEDVWFSVGDNA